MLFLVSVALFVVTPLLVVPELLILLLSESLVDNCFQNATCRLLFLPACQIPAWLISVDQSSILIRLRTWLVIVRCSGSFVLSTCLVCCFQAYWFVVKNGGPLHHNSFRLSCVAEHPLDARSAGLSSDATWTHCSGFDNSWIRAIRFATKVWNDDAVAFIHAKTRSFDPFWFFLLARLLAQLHIILV